MPLNNIVELRPNQRLLDHDFEGYKLNLQALGHYKHDIFPVDRVYPDDVQYSFVHAKLFALHNHLVSDKWDSRYSFYYIDKKQQVRWVSFDSYSCTFSDTVVYDVPAHVTRKPGHFNLCLSFPASDLATVTDGTGFLHIISTEQRSNASKYQSWETLQSFLVLGSDKYVIIIDSKLQEINNKIILHCLLQSVEQNDSHFNSVLTWVTYEKKGDSWKETSMRQLQGKGIVHYAAIETSFQAVYVASDNDFKFTHDTEVDIVKDPEPEKPKIIYTWLQTVEDINLTMKLPENYDKRLFHINVTPATIKVSYAGNIFVEGELKHKVDSHLLTWNFRQDGRIDILLPKSESMIWPDLLQVSDPHGEQLLDPSLVEEAHRRLEHLCSETEVPTSIMPPCLSTHDVDDCDAAVEEDTVLVRLDTNTHKITHKIPLSVHQYLFKITLSAHEAPALALRHDVDACIWQPYGKLLNTDPWVMEHEGTLMAFGYIQSSKQNRKFLTCPSDFSYSVVCEASRHIFIYCNKSSEDFQLRRRAGGARRNVNTGQQYVFNMAKYGEILGIHATSNFLFVLTEGTLFAIEIK